MIREFLAEGRAWRTVLVVAIVGLVGGVFVYREYLADAETLQVDSPGVIDVDRSPAVDEPAPDFLLELPEAGEFIRLSDFRGRTVLLNFWATWCPPCRAEMPEFDEVYRSRLDREDFVVIAVDVQESDAQVQRFVDELGLAFPVAMDRDGAVAQHYGVRGLPATFLIDRDGILRHRIMGPAFGNILLEAIAIADAAGEGE